MTEPVVFASNEEKALEFTQPRLFSLPEDLMEERERQGIYDASRLQAQRPETYGGIVVMLSEGQSIRSIKRVCRVHHYTIQAVAGREGIAIDTGKERVLRDLRMLRRLLVESLTEAVMDGALKPEAMAVALGIVTDKTELLEGGATMRIETSTAASDRPRTWQEFRERMRRRMGLEGEGNRERAIEAEVRVHRMGTEADNESLGLERNSGNGALDGALVEHINAGEGGVSEVASPEEPSIS